MPEVDRGGYYSTNMLNENPLHETGLDRTLTALAHPARRAILRRLSAGEACVTELAAPFEMSLAAVSRHVRVLEEAGLVRRRRVWREHLVSFEPGPLDAALAWMAEQQAFWTHRLDALDELLRAPDALLKQEGEP